MMQASDALFVLPMTTVAHLTLDALLVAAAIIDWRTFRLPNWLTLGGTVLGLAMSAFPQGIGIVESIVGALAMLALLMPIYLLRIAGAGDVKLMAMVGAYLGMPQALFAFALTCLAGGIVAFAFAMRRRSIARMVLNARDLVALTALAAAHGQRPDASVIPSIGKLPYGICVCLGTLVWLAWVDLLR